MKWTLIYFDDQPHNIQCMTDFLSDKFEVVGSTDPTTYAAILNKHQPHAFLLDVHMPVMDGYDLYQKIVEHPGYNGCPIIFISGDLSDENRMKSHDKGAIDFLPRSLKPEEIATRVVSKVKLHMQTSLKLTVGNLTMDLESLKVYINGHIIDLTLLEMRILGTLLRSYPTNITRGELLQKIWGEENIKPGTINTHITNLKPKIKDWEYSIKSKSEKILIQLKDKDSD